MQLFPLSIRREIWTSFRLLGCRITKLVAYEKKAVPFMDRPFFYWNFVIIGYLVTMEEIT